MSQMSLNFPRRKLELNYETAGAMVEKLREFYHGYDYLDDALAIANLICNYDESQDTADSFLMHLGWLVALMRCWKLHPETSVRLEQILHIAIPDYE